VDQSRQVREDRSTRCPSSSTRRSRRSNLEKVGAKLTKLRPDQAKYIGVPEAGPFKGDLYRY